MKNEDEKILQELIEKYPIKNQVSFCEFDIHEKLEENAKLVLFYSDLLIKEESYLEKIDNLLEKVTGERYDFYRFEYDKNLQKAEIERYYLPKDEKIVKMKKIRHKQELRVKFFKLCVNALNKAQWNMKTYSDNMRKGY